MGEKFDSATVAGKRIAAAILDGRVTKKAQVVDMMIHQEFSKVADEDRHIGALRGSARDELRAHGLSERDQNLSEAALYVLNPRRVA